MVSEIYKKNIEVLEKTHKEVFDLLNKDEENLKVDSEVIRVDDSNVLTAVKDEKYIQLESLYDNKRMVECLIDAVMDSAQLDGKLLLFGFGNGMYARYFLEHISKDHQIFVVEPSIKIFKNTISYYDITDILQNNRFHLAITEGYKDSDYRVYFDKMLIFTDLYTVRYTVYNNYQFLFKDELSSWLDQFQYTLGILSSEHHLYEECGEEFIDNNYACFPYVVDSKSLADLIKKMPKDIPAFIVSAGPSLNKNVEQLKKAKGKSLIIAVDGAVNPMIDAGIIPDLMICLDSSKGAEYIKAPGADMIPLVSGMNAGLGFLNAHKGVKLFVSDMNPFIEQFFISNSIQTVYLDCGGSVSTVSFSLARMLGCIKIVTVGLDLAFTGNKSHAQGSVRGQETMDEVKDAYSVITDIDINGEEVQSSVLFKWFKMWHEDQILKYPQLEVIDATEGGALIKGTEIMTLDEAIDKVCVDTFDFSRVLEDTEDLLIGVKKQEFKDYILNLPYKLDEEMTKIHDTKELYGEIKQLLKLKKVPYAVIKDKSRKANELLDSIQSNPSMEYVKYLSQKHTNEMLKTIYNLDDDINDELTKVSNIGTEYLNEIEKQIGVLKLKICNFSFE